MSRATWDADRPRLSSRKGLSPALARRSRRFRSTRECHGSVPQPRTGRNPLGLGSAPFARRYLGYHVCFLFLGVLRCFSSPRSPPAYRPGDCLRQSGCPVRTSADQWLLAPPRGFSQLAASFFASWSLGIHRPPLLSFPSHSDALRRPACSYSRFRLFFSQHVNGLFRPALRLGHCKIPIASLNRCLQAPLQKGGVPAAPSGTATLLRLSPNYLTRPRPLLAVTDFRRFRLSWLDGRCVQGPGTYSPRHG